MGQQLTDALYDTEERLLMIEDVLTGDAWSAAMASQLGAPGKAEELKEGVRQVFMTGGKKAETA